MRHGDFPGDGQSQSGPGLGLAGHTEKTVKNPGVIFFRNAGALVGDAEFNGIIFNQPGPQNNLAVVG